MQQGKTCIATSGNIAERPFSVDIVDHAPGVGEVLPVELAQQSIRSSLDVGQLLQAVIRHRLLAPVTGKKLR